MITAIQPLTSITPSVQKKEVQETQGGQDMFGSVIQSAIDNVKQTDAEKTEAEYLLATGQLDNPATLMTALTKNELSISLLVQLRNKAMDAYSELTRISL